MWIGYRKEQGNWVNTDLAPMSYNRWFPGGPDNNGGNENCVDLRDLGNTNPLIALNGNAYQIGDGNLPFVPGWNDAPCEAVFQYVCQQVLGSFIGKISCSASNDNLL